MGTPKPEDIPYQIGEETRNFISHIDRPKTNFRTVFPKANPLAIDLLDNMLVYNPKNRFNAENCLKHEYLKDFYSEDNISTCKESFDWSFDSVSLKREVLRKVIYDEICSFVLDNEKKKK